MADNPERAAAADVERNRAEYAMASACNFLDSIMRHLDNGDEWNATLEGGFLRDELANLTDAERRPVIAELLGLIEAQPEARHGVLHELTGIERPAPIESDALNVSVLEGLFQDAQSANGDRPQVLERMARRLAAESPFVVAAWAKRCADAGLCTKTLLIDAVKNFSRDDTPPRDIDQIAPDRAPVPTDDDMASAWLKAHPLTAYGLGEYRRYDPDTGVWKVVCQDCIRREVKEIVQGSKANGVRPTARLVGSVAELGRLSVLVTDDKWDADADVLVCANGTLHIPIRTLGRHDPKHYATSGLAWNYDPAATAPMWAYLLDSTVPEAAEFLQEFAGYAITTDTSLEIAVWLYGPPGSGRSTFITGLQAMLGERAGLLGLADVEMNRFALASLPGKTLVVSAEQPADFMHSTHVLNSLISGEPVTLDRKYRDALTIHPYAKILWAMNELPRVPGANNGLFRRVKVVKFPKLIVSHITTLKNDIATEGPGILNWALDGLARLRERGHFDVPACVQSATDEFQQTNDVPGSFVADRCITGPDYKVRASELYAAYLDWCKLTGHKAQSSTSMAEEWKRLGFEKERLSVGVFYVGIGLLKV